MRAALERPANFVHVKDRDTLENAWDRELYPCSVDTFLIDRTGNVAARFSPTTSPTAPDVVDAIEKALGA